MDEDMCHEDAEDQEDMGQEGSPGNAEEDQIEENHDAAARMDQIGEGVVAIEDQ